MIFQLSALTSVSRMCILFVISLLALRHLSPAENIFFHQSLFLQAVMIAFLSSSGMVRGLSVDSESLVEFYRQFLIFLALGVIGIGIVLLMSNLRYNGFFLLLGAWSSALLATSSAVIARMEGAITAYVPQLVSNGLGILLLLFYGFLPFENWFPLDYVSIYVLLQTSSLVFVIACNRKAITKFILSFTPLLRVKRLLDFFSVAFSNSLLLIVFFLFREEWSSNTPSDTSSLALFIFRTADVALQFFVLFISIFFVRSWSFISKGQRLEYLTSYSLVIYLSVLFLCFYVEDSEGLNAVRFLIFLQLATDLIRYLASFCFVATVRDLDNKYIWLITGAPGVVGALVFVLSEAGRVVDLYLLYGMSALSQIGLFLLLKNKEVKVV